MTDLAVEFANTLRASRGRTADGLAEWAERTGTAADPVRLTELRDAIRVLLRAVIDKGEFPVAELGVLNAAAAAAPCWPELMNGPVVVDGPQLIDGPGLMNGPEPMDGPVIVRRTEAGTGPAALAAIARDAIDLIGTGARRATLRACDGPGCVQFFVKDHPRREWCGPACGNRARAARHYRKARALSHVERCQRLADKGHRDRRRRAEVGERAQLFPQMQYRHPLFPAGR
jgi:predicted RNA-binding Zn ribbon-like protein